MKRKKNLMEFSAILCDLRKFFAALSNRIADKENHVKFVFSTG